MALNGSFGFPAVDVAPVSLQADAIVPSMMPVLIWAFVMPSVCFGGCGMRVIFHGRCWRMMRCSSFRRHAGPSVGRCVVGRVNVIFLLGVVFLGGCWSSASI